MARSMVELLSEEICDMAFENKDFSLELERIASDMLKSFFQMRSTFECFSIIKELSNNLSDMDVQLGDERELEDFEVMVEEFRDNLHSTIPDFNELYEAMVDQRQRLGVDIFKWVKDNMDGPFPVRIQALIS